MNKKVALSLLSATVVASMASSALAAPKSGVYLGGEVDRYYAFEDLFKLTDAGNKKFESDLSKVKFENIIYVDRSGTGATMREIFDSPDYDKAKRTLKETDFEGVYTQSNIDGSNGATYDPRKDAVPGPVGDLKVEAVNAINAKQIEIDFSKAVKADSVVHTDGTIVDGVLTLTGIGTVGTVTANDLKASLSEDKKTLTLTAKTTEYFNGQYAVTLKDVTDADGNKVEAYSGILNVNDTTRPTLATTTYDDYKTVRVTFSEPIKDAGTVQLFDGTTELTIPAPTFIAGNKYFTVDLSASTIPVAKNLTLKVFGAVDYKDNVVTPNPVTTTVKKEQSDFDKPVLSTLSVVNDKTFKLTFNEKLNAAPVVKVDGQVVKAAPATGEIKGTVVADSTGLVYTVTMDATLVPTGTSKLHTINVTFSDLSGNAGDEFNKVTEFKVDNVDPKYVSSSVQKISGTEYLVLTFDENVTPENAVGIGNGGKVVVDNVETTLSADIITTDNVTETTGTITPANFTLHNAVDGKSKSVKLDLSSVAAGTYTVSLPANLVADEAGVKNKAAGKITFTRGADSFVNKPTLVTAHDNNGVKAEDTNTVTVKFNQKLDATALNLSNFAIEGVEVKSAIFTKNDATESIIKLTLKEDSNTANGARTVTIKDVKNTSGIAMDPVTLTETLDENVRPTATAAVTDVDTITVTFSEAMTVNSIVESTASADFDLYIGGTKASYTLADEAAVASTGDKKFTVKLTGTGAAFTADDLAKEIKLVATSNFNAADAKGNVANVTEIVVSK
ncbi:hypothetical protein [Brevibacillus sp. 179-C 1.1 NHS]|uniref:hypothetical protein n=1 Tax=Brevibacillus sp. 179-C 1.1 NHS TaxID=3235177 RepID=UPI0039A3B844